MSVEAVRRSGGGADGVSAAEMTAVSPKREEERADARTAKSNRCYARLKR
jgi:hypothetical protein